MLESKGSWDKSKLNLGESETDNLFAFVGKQGCTMQGISAGIIQSPFSNFIGIARQLPWRWLGQKQHHLQCFHVPEPQITGTKERSWILSSLRTPWRRVLRASSCSLHIHSTSPSDNFGSTQLPILNPFMLYVFRMGLSPIWIPDWLIILSSKTTQFPLLTLSVANSVICSSLESHLFSISGLDAEQCLPPRLTQGSEAILLLQ